MKLHADLNSFDEFDQPLRIFLFLTKKEDLCKSSVIVHSYQDIFLPKHALLCSNCIGSLME